MIFSNYPDLLNSQEPWQSASQQSLLPSALRCSSSVPDVGYPSNCGVAYGTFGTLSEHQEKSDSAIESVFERVYINGFTKTRIRKCI